MYYINHYSKVRTTLSTTPEELRELITENNGKYNTKLVEEYRPLTDTRALTWNLIPALSYIIRNNDINNMYEEFKIPKRKGGFRTICAPAEQLKNAQRMTVHMLQKEYRVLPHNAAHGFVKYRNTKTALAVHQKNKSRWFLKLDIEDFFPSTTFEMVMDAFNKVYPFCAMSDVQKETIAMISCRWGVLPQGAPTSPFITNIVMTPIDYEITKLCKKHDLVYTRYADDLLISGKYDFDYKPIVEEVQKLLGQYKLKDSKLRYGNFNGRNWNLGLMYNNKYEVTVGHAKKKLLKNLVHNYTTKPECRTIENRNYIMGLLSYCSYIEPEYFRPLKLKMMMC